GNQLGGDRHTAHVLAVLTGVAVIGKDHSGPGCAGPLEAVQHDQQLHEVLIDRRAGRLNQEDIAAAHILLDAYGDLTIREIGQRHLAERVIEHVGDVFRKPDVGPAAEDLELIVVVHGQ